MMGSYCAPTPLRYCVVLLVVFVAAVVRSGSEGESVEGNLDQSCSSGVVVVTGANKGIGFDAIVQLAKDRRFTKYFLTVRSVGKGDHAVANASRLSGLPSSKFGYVVMDLEDTASVMTGVAKLPDNIAALVLNAGGLGLGDELTKDGVHRVFARNTLGHVALVEGLFSAGKIVSDGNSRVIFSGSEMSRPVWAMVGFQAWPVIEKGKLAEYMRIPPTQGTWGVNVRIMHAAYGSSKTIGGLWLSQLAKEHPNVYFATVSPGGTLESGAMGHSVWPLNVIASSPIAGAMFRWLGAVHSKEDCVKRYVTALTQDDFPSRFPSGSVLGSPSSIFPFYIGAAGPLTNQKDIYPVFADPDLQEEAARAVRAKMKEVTKAL